MSERHLTSSTNNNTSFGGGIAGGSGMLPISSEGFMSPINTEAVANTALPEVVGKLFMLDDTFFRSPFLREKLPPLLFSNGNSGFDRFFADFGAPHQHHSARASFFQPHQQQQQQSDEDIITGESDIGEGPPTPTNFSNSYGSNSNNRFNNFESPEQFHYQQQQQHENGIIRNIPIKIESSRKQSQPEIISSSSSTNNNYSSALSQPQPPTLAYSHQHHHNSTPHYATVTSSNIQTSYPRGERGGETDSISTNSSTPSIFQQHPQKTYSVPIYQRETSAPVIFRRSQPDSISIKSAQFPSEERATSEAGGGLYSQIKRSQSSGRVSPSSYSLAAAPSTTPATAAAPEPPQRRSFSRLLQSSQNQRPTSEIFESRLQQQHQQRQEASTPTPTSSTTTLSMPSYRFDQQQQHQRPTTPLSQKSRPKSPSLQSLKNGFRKATNCVRRPQGCSDGSDGEGMDMKPAASLISMQPSTTSNLYAAISKPTPVNISNNNNNSKRYEEIDAVEEAIRSLESFDPNKIIADAAAEKRNNGNVSNSDSDSGSIIIRKDQTQRPSESPTSSGIVSDIRDGSVTRTSGFSNRSSGGSSHERASISSSDNDAGSYILIDPNRHRFNPPSTSSSTAATASSAASAVPQPPSVSRIAYQFGNPQRAIIVASPSSSTTSTLTRGDHIGPQRINDTTFRPQTSQPKVLPPPPEIITQTDSSNEGEDAAIMRKRILCAQMTDCAKVIEINGLKMAQFTSSSNWRHPHLLQRNIPGIQDTVYIIEAALDELLEFTQRISIGRGDPKQDEFIQMVAPLRTSQALIHRLRATLDSAQWNIHSLSRLNGNPVANDALDQFGAILNQLPKDCRKLVQWVYLLGTPSQSGGGANFLPRHSPGAQPFPIISSTPIPETFEKQQIPSVPEYLAPRGGPRQQQPPQRPPPPVRQPVQSQQQQISPLSLLSPPTMEEIAMDGGESTTSSNGSSSNATDIVPQTSSSATNSITPTIEQQQPQHGRNPSTTGSVMEEDDLVSIAESTTKQVYEEDDLMSVMSESSLYQDYSLLGENGSLPRPHHQQRLRQSRNIPKINSVLFKDISEAEKDLLRPYAFELDNHMMGLCQLIEEFFNIIEQTSHEPSNFVQKVRMLILKAQFLVNIGDHMAQCIAKPALRSEFRHASDRLNSLLTQCVSNAQIAKEQYPSVEAVQAMMSSVVAVSDAAQHLKQLGKSCI